MTAATDPHVEITVMSELLACCQPTTITTRHGTPAMRGPGVGTARSWTGR